MKVGCVDFESVKQVRGQKFFGIQENENEVWLLFEDDMIIVPKLLISGRCIGCVEKIRGKKVVLKKEENPDPKFKRRLLIENIVHAETKVEEGNHILYREGKLIVETGTDDEGEPIEGASVYSCYALATERELHAVEKRTN